MIPAKEQEEHALNRKQINSAVERELRIIVLPSGGKRNARASLCFLKRITIVSGSKVLRMQQQ